jgi:hypothetical protein
MISREQENLISRYDDPELRTSEREQLSELLETEDKARELEAQYRRLDAELETLPDGLEGVDFSGFRRQIRESIESASAPVIRLPYRRLWIRWAPIAAAASVAIAILSIWHSLKQPPTGHEPVPPIVQVRTNNVKLANVDVKPPGAVVNRIELGAPSEAEESIFAVDIESDGVYDDGGVICFVGTESEGKVSSVPSAGGFFGALLKGST